MVGLAFGVVSALGAAGRMASGLMSANARQGEFDAEVRALSMKRDQTLGSARAAAGASGTDVNSVSTGAYLAGLANEFDTEINAVRKAKKDSGVASVIGSLFGALGDAGSVYGQLGAANNWWR